MTGLSISAEKPTSLTYAQGICLVIMAGVFWSSLGLGIRLIEYANVWQILLYRSISLSLFLLLIISVRSNFKPFKTIKAAGFAAAIGAMGLVLAFASGIYALQTTNVANALFLFASAPFIAAILGRVFLNELIDKVTMLSMIVAIIGIIIMVRDGIAAGQLIGNICAVLAALGFAIFTIALRWGKVNDMLPTVFLAGIFSMLIAIMVCISSGFAFELTIRDTAISLAMGIFQIGVGLTIFTLGSKVVPAAELTLLSMTEVLLGPFWVWLFLGESVSVNTLVGGLILLSAIASSAIIRIQSTSKM